MALALENKADVNAAAKDGRTAVFVACETAADNESVCLAMLQNGDTASPNLMTPHCAICMSCSCVAGAQANVTQLGTMKTALHMAAASGSVAVVRALLRA